MSNSKRKPPASRSKGSRPTANKTAAQKRLAAQRAMAAASGATAARRKRLYAVLLPVLVVLIVVVVLIIVKVVTDKDKPANTTSTAAAQVVAEVTGVPADVLDTVAGGPKLTAPKALTGDALTSGGLPRVLYVGAEWCPFCAAERWPLAVALSRFGTLKGLGQTASTPNDVYPDTPTLSFHGVTYSSKYLSFTGAEIENGAKKPLDTLAPADEQLFTKIGGGGFPFVDIGGKYAIGNAQYDPKLLHGKTHAQIAAALSDPSSSIGKSIDGSANVITAAICRTTNDEPAAVCTSPGVAAAAKKLP